MDKTTEFPAYIGPNASDTIVRWQNAAYHMEHEPIDGCIVCSEANGSYTVLDNTGQAEIKVSFLPQDDSAAYVFYIDKQKAICTNSFEEVKQCISKAVSKKLDKRKRTSAPDRAAKITTYYNAGIPMALITPDTVSDSPAEKAAKRKKLKRELDDIVRTYGFGYNQVRGGYLYADGEADVCIDRENSFIIYGKPDKKSEQLLKPLATEFGKKYAQKSVVFCDLNGNIYFIRTDADKNKIDTYALRDIQKAMLDFYGSFTGPTTDRTFCFSKLCISENYEPFKTFQSTSKRIRRRNAFFRYCDACWDEASQTYHFDDRFSRDFI